MKLSGRLARQRQRANGDADGALGTGFHKLHPQLRFERWLKGSGSGMYGLEMRTVDIALMGRPINPYERYGVYERAWVVPGRIEVATGSFNQPHKSPAYAIFVHNSTLSLG